MTSPLLIKANRLGLDSSFGYVTCFALTLCKIRFVKIPGRCLHPIVVFSNRADEFVCDFECCTIENNEVLLRIFAWCTRQVRPAYEVRFKTTTGFCMKGFDTIVGLKFDLLGFIIH